MRTLLLLLLFGLCAASCAAPKKHIDTGTEVMGKYSLRRAAASGALAFVSGASWGVHETVVHHPNRIPDSWNRQWWDARISWTNKGTGLWGRTFGAFGSDAKHTFGTLHRWSGYGSGLVITIGERRPWRYVLLDAAIGFAGFSAGFHGVYSLYFKE